MHDKLEKVYQVTSLKWTFYSAFRGKNSFFVKSMQDDSYAQGHGLDQKVA